MDTITMFSPEMDGTGLYIARLLFEITGSGSTAEANHHPIDRRNELGFSKDGINAYAYMNAVDIKQF